MKLRDAAPSPALLRCDKCNHKFSNHKPTSRGKYAKIKGVKFRCTVPLSVHGPVCACSLTENEIEPVHLPA
jgi:hypothetical protein